MSVTSTERLKAIVTKDYLEQVCRQYQTEKGTFGARTPVAVFRRPGSIAIVWKQHFTIRPASMSRRWFWCSRGPLPRRPCVRAVMFRSRP